MSYFFSFLTRCLTPTALNYNLMLLCFNPHTRYRLRPPQMYASLDLLSKLYEQEVRRWLVNYPECAVTFYQAGKLYNAAFQRAASVQTAKSCLEKSWLHYINRDIFLDHLCTLSETIESSYFPSWSKTNKLDKRRGETAVLTSSSYKNELQADLKEEEEKNKPKISKNFLAIVKKTKC